MNIQRLTSEIAQCYPREQLIQFLELSRTWIARSYEMIGKTSDLPATARAYLPRGQVLRSPVDNSILCFLPAPEEYPSPDLGGGVALQMASMSHHRRYQNCLGKQHVLNLFPKIDMNAFLHYSNIARQVHPDPFSQEIEEWINEIAKESAVPYNNEYQEID